MSKNDDKYVNTLPWIEKYRPKSLDSIYSHTEIVSTLKKFIETKTLPHLLFYGPPGTGKTSCITACAKELYGKHFSYMVLELNASDDRGIEVVRHRIKQFVITKGMFADNTNKMFKLVILDETDAMTGDAQAILRKIVEEYTFNTRFCLICNYIDSINPALQSRCMRLRFSLIDEPNMRKKLLEIAKSENLKVTDSGITTVIKRSNGDMRRACNILQSVSMTYPLINRVNVNYNIGYPNEDDVQKITDILLNGSFKDAYNFILDCKNDDGFSLNDIIQELHNVLVTWIKEKDYSKMEYNKILDVLDKIRAIENNQYTTSCDNIQIGALVGIFKKNI